MNERISPPALRRRVPSQKHEAPSPTAVCATVLQDSLHGHDGAGTLRLFSWNVNGIAPFVKPYLSSRSIQQRDLRSFFGPDPTKRTRKRDQIDTSDESDSSGGRIRQGQRRGVANGKDEDPRREGEPSLRSALRRYGWPQLLFLQEVKIKHGDDQTMNAVRAAVNDASPRVISRSADTSEEGRSINHQENVTDSAHRVGDGGPVYDVHFNLPWDRHNATGWGGKLYGVAAVIRRDFAERYVECVRDVDWDREGRIQVIETKEVTFPFHDPTQIRKAWIPSQQEQNFKYALINVYAVNGTSAAYRSSETGALVGTRHDRKLALQYELLCEAKRLEAKGFAVVIAGDLNVARDGRDGYPNLRTNPHQHVLNRADFNQKFFSDGVASLGIGARRALYSTEREKGLEFEKSLKGLDAIDTFRHIRGAERRYTYHSRGREWGASCDRVDLVMASKTLDGIIVDAGICDNQRDRGPSDHCPVWVELGLTT
ncbi:Endonuclease/exonuclease/phosphatase [Xylariaceae sp. FL1272]|nr:Endonuclease/exonuclease/phosphatase [Xylariaceae sp. FL1272]